MPWPKATWLVSVRVTSKVCGAAYRAGSRFTAASEMITWAKAGMTIPPSATSCVVYLNVECGTGASHRRISSIACGTRAGSATSASRCSGVQQQGGCSVADQAGRGVVPGHHQLEDRGEHLLLGQRVALIGHAYQVGH
jgi:hypothetical protein